MALNGLDSSSVTDAYKAAVSDSGGWLLLSYTSRDEVDIYSRGNGGAPETSEALTEYANKSPLYGFLHYRNKKILLKYIPEGTSRLLQARTSVHWSTVTDAFSPHDALLEASQPDDLDADNLDTLCGLPPEKPAPPPPPPPAAARTASPSPRFGASPSPRPGASPSPRPMTPQRPITPQRQVRDSPSFDGRSQPSRTNFYDDSTETPRAHVRTPNQTSKDSTSSPLVPSPARSARRDLDVQRPDRQDTEAAVDRPRTQPQPQAQLRSREAMSLAAFLNDVPPPSAVFTAHRNDSNIREFSPSPDSSAYRPSTEQLEPPKSSYSSKSGRPSTSDIWRSFKPKLKLHPRPVENQTQQQPSGVRQRLPAGLRVRQRKTDKYDDRPKSRKSEKNFLPADQVMTSANAPPRTSSRPSATADVRRARSPEEEPPLPPLPTDIDPVDREPPRVVPRVVSPMEEPPPLHQETPPLPPAKIERPSAGYGQGRRNLTLGIDTSSAQTNRMSADTFALLSPEKQRLMKALELRKRQLNAPAQPRSSHEGPDTFLATLSSGKTDSGVDIEEIRAAEAERNRPRLPLQPPQHTPVSVSTETSSPRPPQTPRRHNPALQSHPTGDVEAFAVPPFQPPLPPPPKDLPTQPQTKEHSIPRKEVPRPSPSTDSPSTERGVLSEEVQNKRRGFVQQAPSDQDPSPIAREDPVEAPDGVAQNPEFMQELESATVQEAKSMPIATRQVSAATTSRSATPVMIERSSSKRIRPSGAETIAHAPADGGSGPPSPELVRPNTSSGPAVDRLNGGSRRLNVSTGISRRLQALAEMNDDLPMSSLNAAQATYDPAQSFLAPGALPPITTNTQSILARSYDESRGTSPARSMQRTLPRRQSNDSQRTTDTAKKRDTVSITAHIQRNPQAGKPLVIEEESYDYSPVDYPHPTHSRTISRTSTSRTDGHRPGSSHSNRPVSRGSTITSFTRTSLDVWRPGGSRRLGSAMRPPNSMSNTSLDRVDEVSEARSSRTSKLLKRMSGFGATKQKPPSEAESLPSMDERKMLSPPRPTSIIVGDLSVQYPDTLLWKRRWVEVDGNGNLVISASPSRDLPNGSRKKYHLSDFKTPMLPTPERQEKDYSVALDFVGGGGSVQLATEDAIGQASILRRLGDAHRAWLYYET